MVARAVVPEALRTDWGDQLQSGIPPTAGQDVFARILASGHRRVLISPTDLTHTVELTPEPSNKRPEPSNKRNAAANRSDELAPTLAVPERPELSSAFVEPATETERRLAEIWTELLGVGRIGAHDDFFELGGHSLIATRVLARIDNILGARLTLREIFDAPTIHRLAKQVDNGTPVRSARITEMDKDREEFEF
jgi:hypothetical protein